MRNKRGNVYNTLYYIVLRCDIYVMIM